MVIMTRLGISRCIEISICWLNGWGWMGFKLLEFRANDENAIGGLGVLFEIVLVIFFRPVESLERDNLGRNGYFKLGFLRLLRGLGELLLFRCLVKNDRAILSTHVVSLLIWRCRIVDI